MCIRDRALKDKIGPEAMQDPEVLRNWTCNLAQHPEYMGPTSGTIPAMLQKTELWLFAKSAWLFQRSTWKCKASISGGKALM